MIVETMNLNQKAIRKSNRSTMYSSKSITVELMIYLTKNILI